MTTVFPANPSIRLAVVVEADVTVVPFEVVGLDAAVVWTGRVVTDALALVLSDPAKMLDAVVAPAVVFELVIPPAVETDPVCVVIAFDRSDDDVTDVFDWAIAASFDERVPEPGVSTW